MSILAENFTLASAWRNITGMSVAKKKVAKVTVEEVVEMAGRLSVKDRLRVISKLADELSTEALPKKPRKPITQYAFVGMWKDREDMKDSVAWVRALRAHVEEERRRRWTKS